MDKRFPIRRGPSTGRWLLFAKIGLAEWYLCSASRYDEALRIRRALKVLLAAKETT